MVRRNRAVLARIGSEICYALTLLATSFAPARSLADTVSPEPASQPSVSRRLPVTALAQTVSPLPSEPDLSEPDGLQKSFQAVADRVSKSVVAISASFAAVDADASLRSEELNPEKLEGFLDRATRTVGTGFVIDAGGYILTNQHVVAETEQLWITTDDRKVFPAMIVGSDPRHDLAVLKIPSTVLTPVRFSSEPVKRGQWSIAIGNPFGLAGEGEMVMSVGIISAVDRSLPKLSNKENRLYSDLLQTTAQINPGNSGGPLFDLSGKVIGINTAVIMPQKQMNGIGFAMPVSAGFMRRVENLMNGREIVPGYLGVVVSTPTAKQLHEAHLPETCVGGAVVEGVEANAPAEGVLKAGDVVLDVGGEMVRDSDHFVRIVGDAGIETPVHFRVRRGGKNELLDVTLRRRELPVAAVTKQNQRLHWRGMLLASLPAHWEARKGKTQGGVMVLSIDPTSPLVNEGISAGSVITQVAGRNVLDVSQLQDVLNDVPAERCTVTALGPADGAVAASGN